MATQQSRLRELREARGLSLDRLAERAGVNRNTIRRAEASPHPKMQSETAMAVARALHHRLNLSLADFEWFARVGGFSASVLIADLNPAPVSSSLLHGGESGEQPVVASPRRGPDLLALLDAAVSAAGSRAVTEVLRALAGPARDEVPRRRSLMVVHPPERVRGIDGDYEVQVFAPVEPPRAAPRNPASRPPKKETG